MEATDPWYLARVRIPEDPAACWLWTGAKTVLGYGQGRRKDKQPYAHRIMWNTLYGEIPAGHVVCHVCDVPSCVNPSHLFVGTQKDNMRDKQAKGRAAGGARGTQNGNAVLDPEKVRWIRAEYASKRGEAGLLDMLALTCGVQKCAVWDVILYRSWRHVK